MKISIIPYLGFGNTVCFIVIFGDCSRELADLPNYDGRGVNAHITSPSSPQMASDGSLRFVDNDTAIRMISNGEVTTLLGK